VGTVSVSSSGTDRNDASRVADEKFYNAEVHEDRRIIWHRYRWLDVNTDRYGSNINIILSLRMDGASLSVAIPRTFSNRVLSIMIGA